MYSFVLHQSRCTNNCVFCNSRDFGEIEKNIEEELKKLKKIIQKGEKISAIEISGNDPGEYNELPKVVQKIKQLTSAETIVLTTHGKTLKNENFLQNLIEAGITHFTIALYGHNAQTHDAVTQCSGSFSLTMESLILMHSLEQEINITSLIMRENQDFIYEMLQFFGTISSRVLVGIPCYVPQSRFKKSIPDFQKLQNDLSEALEKAKSLPLQITLKDIPFCFTKTPYEKTISSQIPDEGYEHWREKEKLESGFVQEKEGKIVPLYRIMEKQEQCKNCKYFEKCPGFYKTYLDEYKIELKPIQ